MRANMLMNKKGFTLIELLVALVISSIVMAAIYSVYRAQTKQHRTQQMVVQMQQNIRAAMYLLEREIRMAGYSTASPPASAGFVDNLSAYGEPSGPDFPKTDEDEIAFTMDNDGDGTLTAATSFELIAFRRDAANNTLERWDAAGSGWQAAAEQITSLNFTYFRAGTPPNPLVVIPFPITAADMVDIIAVRVDIEATAGDRPPMGFSNIIKCRNTGL